MIRKINNLIHPITNLCIDDNNNVLFATSGGNLISTVISINNENYKNNISSTLKVYDNFVIQGLKIINNNNNNDNNLILFGNNSLNIYNYNITNDNTVELFEIFKLQNLSDLILDCDIICNNDNIILVIGYAHNFIDIIDLSKPFSLISNILQSNQLSQHIYRICCSENCMLFSMSMNIIYDNNNNIITIASGTAFGKIILWKIEFNNINYSEKISNLSSSLLPKVTSLSNTSFLLPSSSSSSNIDNSIPKSQIMKSLLDHEGVIFNISWSKNKKFILTVSDDRTVRMWDVIEGKQIFVGWGHISRVWDATFINYIPRTLASDLSLFEDNHNNNGEVDENTHIATSSEDNTIKIWNIISGTCIATLRGHTSDVWCCISAFNGTVLISGGNDAAIKFWIIASHLQSSPEVDDSTIVEISIPDWKYNTINNLDSLPPKPLVNSDVTIEVSNDMNIDINKEDNENLVVGNAAKPVVWTPPYPCRRKNGVSFLKISPNGNWIILAMIDGGLWLVSTSQYNVTGSSNKYTCNKYWFPVTSLGKKITCGDVGFYNDIFINTNMNIMNNKSDKYVDICVICSHPDGTVSAVKVYINQTDRNSFKCKGDTISWKSHDLRTINIWLLPILNNNSIDKNYNSVVRLLTVSVKGMCKLWNIQMDKNINPEIVIKNKLELYREFVTGKNQIATSCSLIKKWINITNELGEYLQIITDILIIGDSRGGITLISLDNNYGENACFYQFINNAHLTEPVSCLQGIGFSSINQTNSINILDGEGFCSLGHDGYLNIYTCCNKDVNNKQSNQYHWLISNRISCLPIKTPLQLYTTRDGNTPSYYVGGFLGAMFIVWDVMKQYQVIRVSGGSWKRPHHFILSLLSDNHSGNNQSFIGPATFSSSCTTLNNNHNNSNQIINNTNYNTNLLPRIVFCCPAPVNDSTVLLYNDSLIRKNNHIDNYDDNTITLFKSLPLHLGISSLGKVCYSSLLLRGYEVDFEKKNEKNHYNSIKFSLIGGEEGKIKIFKINSNKNNNMNLFQEISMPTNVAIKALNSSQSSQSSQSSSIVIGVGSKLVYSIWTYNDHVSDNSFNNILLLSHVGSTMVKATQDHRFLTVSSSYLREIILNDIDIYHSYSIIFGDSRGVITIARYNLYIKSVDNRVNLNSSSLYEPKISNFKVLEEYILLNKEYPILSSSSLVLRKDNGIVYIIGCFGDTSGEISVWLLAGSMITNENELEKSLFLFKYEGHAMGANGMSANVIPSKNELENTWDFVICSGGDDQSLALCSGTFIANNDKSNKYISIDSLNLYRFDGSSGSAINCVELMTDRNDNNNIYIASVGYDRRLSLWKYDNSFHLNSSNGYYNDLIKLESCLYPLVLNVNNSKDNHNLLKWLSGQMVSVGDVGSMNASIDSDNDSDIFADIVVAGEGMQMFQIKL